MISLLKFILLSILISKYQDQEGGMKRVLRRKSLSPDPIFRGGGLQLQIWVCLQLNIYVLK